MTSRVDDLSNSSTNTYLRAQDLLSFINNMTMDIHGRTQHYEGTIKGASVELNMIRFCFTQ